MDSQTAQVPVVALVVAAGSGSRLGADRPKALVEAGGVPLVARAVRHLAAGGAQEAIVVIPDEHEDAFSAALTGAPIPCTFVPGGAERQESVARGLATIAARGDEDQVVLVHDAARAFVPATVVARVVNAVRQGAPAVVPVVGLADSVRELTEEGSAVVDRARLRGVQTPQGFQLGTLLDAHAALADHGTVVTDDAAAAEFIGVTVTLVEGDPEAFKVTTPLDLVLAEALTARRGER